MVCVVTEVPMYDLYISCTFNPHFCKTMCLQGSVKYSPKSSYMKSSTLLVGKGKIRRCASYECGEWNLRRLIQHWSEASQAQTHTMHQDHECFVSHACTNHNPLDMLRFSMSLALESSRTLSCKRHAVWIDCQLSNPRATDVFFSNKSSPGDVWSHLPPLHTQATTGTSPSWVTYLRYMNERVGRKLNKHNTHQCQVTVHRVDFLSHIFFRLPR